MVEALTGFNLFLNPDACSQARTAQEPIYNF